MTPNERVSLLQQMISQSYPIVVQQRNVPPFLDCLPEKTNVDRSLPGSVPRHQNVSCLVVYLPL